MDLVEGEPHREPVSVRVRAVDVDAADLVAGGLPPAVRHDGLDAAESGAFEGCRPHHVRGKQLERSGEIALAEQAHVAADDLGWRSRPELAGVLQGPVPEGPGGGAGELLNGVRDLLGLLDEAGPVREGVVRERGITGAGDELFADLLGIGFGPAHRQASGLADDAGLAGLGNGLRPGEDVLGARVLAFGQGPDRDVGDIALVDERPGRLAVDPADHAAGADLIRPGQRIGGEAAGPQEHPFRPGLFDDLLDLAPDAVLLRLRAVAHGHRGQVDDAADLAREGGHGGLRALRVEEGPEQERGVGARCGAAERVRAGQVTGHGVFWKARRCRVAGQRANGHARVPQLGDDVAADVSGGPGDEDR